jgi:hypothetical protein
MKRLCLVSQRLAKHSKRMSKIPYANEMKIKQYFLPLENDLPQTISLLIFLWFA